MPRTKKEAQPKTLDRRVGILQKRIKENLEYLSAEIEHITNTSQLRRVSQNLDAALDEAIAVYKNGRRTYEDETDYDY